ncbi:MAG: tRNA (adenosine(37)-N6)-dimethylallyltransferase MiaA [Lentimicrobium sp.]|jgi:tRNA dimethylallyltransferase|nr:tRNA (adenosine(37)-N6)-dimethylallyltransferase MiaA [Lentimicrobium sp.]
MPQAPLLIVLTGPTAVGKTSVAIEVARHLQCDIVSADSRQFYRELSIGTAAPTDDQLRAVKHHFVGQLSLEDPYDVSKYEAEVLDLLSVLFKKNPCVVLTGGSGLYLQAVYAGMDSLPDSDPRIRQQLREQFENEGIASIRQLLRKLDPDYYSTVDLANPNRILRALEVCMGTGAPFSSFRKSNPVPRNFNTIKIGLDLPRAELHNRINARVDQMIADGLVDEARHFYSLRHLNALNTVGYKELFDFFDGSISLEVAIEKIKTNTRRYARRQLTWFRKDKEFIWCQPSVNEVIECIISLEADGCRSDLLNEQRGNPETEGQAD